VSLGVRYVDLAEADIVEAWEWHENQQSGLGDRFVRSVKAAVDQAQRGRTAASQLPGTRPTR
jgi:hypothetical protein